MFTYLTKIQLDPDFFIEPFRKIKNEIMPALLLQKGFAAALLQSTPTIRRQSEARPENSRRSLLPYRAPGSSENF